ncbi:ABC transporter permease [Mycoplasmopsis edwardii]|uniref:ABC transporter permease n=1 Tax=Mycoplasmopsis edwardii TaxID=53558 RepID=UPI001CB79043|nr:ABC transporter permease [Mycoplasmopsis edwardii]
MYELNFFSHIYTKGFVRLKHHLSELFKFNSQHPDLPGDSLWKLNLDYIWITLKTVTGGTITGLILSSITSYLSATNIHKNREPSFILKFILVFFRAFPFVVFILLFKSIFSSFLAAWMIFCWSTWLWMHKYYLEIIESAETKYYWLDIKLGKSKLVSFYKNIYLSNRNRYVMNSFLSYESNVRWSAILGRIGIIGIGFWIDTFSSDFSYLGISLFYLFMVVFVIEIFMFLYNKYLKSYIHKRTKDQDYWKSPIYNLTWIILLIVKIVFLVIYIISFVDLANSTINFTKFGKYLKDFYVFDFSDIKVNYVYYLDYWVIFMKTYVSLYFAVLISIVFAFYMSERINNVWVSFTFKVLLVVIKSLPVVVYFVLFNTFLEPVTSITIVLSLVAFRSLTKHFNSKINAFSNYELKLCSSLGFSTWWIYRKRILPEAFKDIRSLIVFEYENTFRNGISYGVFATITITEKINDYQEKNLYGRIFPLILPAFLFFILLEIFYWIIKNDFKLNKLFNWIKNTRNNLSKSFLNKTKRPYKN